jgi:hypothetical protein
MFMNTGFLGGCTGDNRLGDGVFQANFLAIVGVAGGSLHPQAMLDGSFNLPANARDCLVGNLTFEGGVD